MSRHNSLSLLFSNRSSVSLFRFVFSVRFRSLRSFHNPSMASLAASSISMHSRPRLSHQSSEIRRISSLESGSLAIYGRGVLPLRMQPLVPRFRICCAAKPETVDKVCSIVRKQLALPDDSAVTGESKFTALGADSLDTVEIVMGLEEEFDISVEEESAQGITTVQDAADLIEKLVEEKVAA